MKRENFYRRDPGAALAGMAGMSLEERGVYNTIIDLLYLTWRPVEDSASYIAGHCGCAVQKLNPILRKLIERGKLVRFQEGGQSYISNPTFERERAAVKGASNTRSGRSDPGQKSPGVGEKSGEVGEKSEGVEENPRGCDDEGEKKQGVTPLEKSRVDESRHSEANASGAEAPPGDANVDPDSLVWTMAARLLAERGGLDEKSARRFFGKLVSANGLEARDLLPAVSNATVNGTLDPKSYLTRAAKQVGDRRAARESHERADHPPGGSPDPRRANTDARRNAWADVIAERNGLAPGHGHNGGREGGADPGGGGYPRLAIAGEA